MSWTEDREKLLGAILGTILTIALAVGARVLVRQEQVLERLVKIEANQTHMLYRIEVIEQTLRAQVHAVWRLRSSERSHQGENEE